MIQVFINKYQWLTIFIHSNFASFCLFFEIFVRNKITYKVNSNKHNKTLPMQMWDQNPIKWLTVGNFDVTSIVTHYKLL